MTTRLTEAERQTAGSLSAYGKARSTVQGAPLTEEDLARTDAYLARRAY